MPDPTDDKSYKNLIVWQKAMDMTVLIYRLTKDFPASELYGLTSQIRRAASSIPANIAEGSRRRGAKDQLHFFVIAFGSGSELETHLELAKRLAFAPAPSFVGIESLLSEVMRMLNRLTNGG